MGIGNQSQYHSQWGKVHVFSCKSKEQNRKTWSSYFYLTSMEFQARRLGKKKRGRCEGGFQIKEEVKLALCLDDIT